MTDRSDPKDASEEAAKERHKCVDCGTLSPPTQTNYTLISAQHGWRLTRAIDANGRKSMEWRCPSCWNSGKWRRDKK